MGISFRSERGRFMAPTYSSRYSQRRRWLRRLEINILSIWHAWHSNRVTSIFFMLLMSWGCLYILIPTLQVRVDARAVIVTDPLALVFIVWLLSVHSRTGSALKSQRYRLFKTLKRRSGKWLLEKFDNAAQIQHEKWDCT